jgi:hypothetical protein
VLSANRGEYVGGRATLGGAGFNFAQTVLPFGVPRGVGGGGGGAVDRVDQAPVNIRSLRLRECEGGFAPQNYRISEAGVANLAMRSFASRHRGEFGGLQVCDELSDFARPETE